MATNNALKAYLGPERTAMAVKQAKELTKTKARGLSKKVIRLPDGARDGVAKVVEQSIADGGPFGSMNTWFVDALVWWINIQRESHSLLLAAVELDQEQPPTQG
ncbi:MULTISPECIES: hypothetical protein [Pseudomonas]|nr:MULTISPECIES: hypothetical protein [Pseudomonas]